MNKKLCSMILAIMLLTSQVYAGNMPGYMTPDQKAALDGANAPSASNVLATEADVAAADTGVQTAGAGVNLSNSGDADNPILDVDVSEDIDMNTDYQLINLQAPAAAGEAIRQTAKISESILETIYDNRVDTWTAPLGKSSQTVAMTNVNSTDTHGYMTWQQYVALALLDGTRAFTGQQDFQDGIKADTIVESTVDAGVNIEGTDFENNDINTGSITIAEDAGATTLVDRSVTATPGAGVEQSDAFLIDTLWVAKSYAEADGSGSVKNRKWKMYAGYFEPLAIADSPINPVEGDFWFESTAADSGLNQYHGGAWERILTDESGYTQSAADALLANKQALDTALTNISALAYVSASFIKLTADDTYAVRTIAETKQDLSLNNVSNVATSDTAYDDTSWNANSDAATKNAIRDKVNTMDTAIGLNTAKTTNATHTGEVTGSGELTITADAVTYDKMQDTSGTDVLLGRSTAGGGTVEEIACTSVGRNLLDDATVAAQKTTLGKVIDSEETNLQTIMRGSVTVSTTDYDGTATITYGKTFTAIPIVVVTVAETLNAGYDNIVNVEDIGYDTCILRLIDCVDDDSSISVGYIVMGDE